MTVVYVPGLSAAPATLRRRAFALIAALLAAAGLIAAVIRVTPDRDFSLRMVTSEVADGVGRHTAVTFNGVKIGTVDSVASPHAGRRVVDMRIRNAYRDVVTTSTAVSYAPSNLFGITALVLQGNPGGRPLERGEEFMPAKPPADQTVPALLRTLTDLNEHAFGPNMGTILPNVNSAVSGLLPVMGAVGRLAEIMVSTQTMSTAESIPKLTALVGTTATLVGDLMPGLRRVWEWSGPSDPGYPEAQAQTIARLVDELVPVFLRMEVPQVLDLVRTIVPVWRSFNDRAFSTFPDARANGLEIRRLIGDINAAMPAKDGGVALNVDLIVGSLPGVAAALGLAKAGPR